MCMMLFSHSVFFDNTFTVNCTIPNRDNTTICHIIEGSLSLYVSNNNNTNETNNDAEQNAALRVIRQAMQTGQLLEALGNGNGNDNIVRLTYLSNFIDPRGLTGDGDDDGFPWWVWLLIAIGILVLCGAVWYAIVSYNNKNSVGGLQRDDDDDDDDDDFKDFKTGASLASDSDYHPPGGPGAGGDTLSQLTDHQHP